MDGKAEPQLLSDRIRKEAIEVMKGITYKHTERNIRYHDEILDRVR